MPEPVTADELYQAFYDGALADPDVYVSDRLTE